MINCVVMSFGYVETSVPGRVIFLSNTEYSSKEEALSSLACDLYLTYRKEYFNYPELDSCCKQTAEKFSDAKFCHKCGSPCKKHLFRFENLQEFVNELYCMTADHLGYFEMTSWDMWCHDKDFYDAVRNDQVVSVHAEEDDETIAPIKGILQYLKNEDIMEEDKRSFNSWISDDS